MPHPRCSGGTSTAKRCCRGVPLGRQLRRLCSLEDVVPVGQLGRSAATGHCELQVSRGNSSQRERKGCTNPADLPEYRTGSRSQRKRRGPTQPGSRSQRERKGPTRPEEAAASANARAAGNQRTPGCTIANANTMCKNAKLLSAVPQNLRQAESMVTHW